MTQKRNIIKYVPPQKWVSYDMKVLIELLIDAKAAVQSLKTVPFQKDWVQKLQYIQLKREVAGTSRIEGADFTENELEAALNESPEELFTRSQKQARAAKNTYLWIANLEDERPIDKNLIFEVHRRIVTGADDDHCPPGVLRGKDKNVIFGAPSHRGAEGGTECEEMFNKLVQASQREFKDHDLLIQALALHYHFAAIHPFLDGNGRTARALEALMLQRVGLRDSAFIAMSNYYYDEKVDYLNALTQARAGGHDLTPFLAFGLRGITKQCRRLFDEINKNVSKALYRNLMFDLFSRLRTERKRVIAKRQIEVLKVLLDRDTIEWNKLVVMTKDIYSSLKNPLTALVRDVNQLSYLGAIRVTKESNPDNEGDAIYVLHINLSWPTEISESDFMAKIKELPTVRSQSFI